MFDLERLRKKEQDRYEMRLATIEAMAKAAEVIEGAELKGQYDEWSTEILYDLAYTYDAPYEEVVEKVAGPVHRALGVDWTLQVEATRLILKTPYIQTDNGYSFKIALIVDLAASGSGCKIIRKLVRERTPVELESYRYVYEYFVKCD